MKYTSSGHFIQRTIQRSFMSYKYVLWLIENGQVLSINNPDNKFILKFFFSVKDQKFYFASVDKIDFVVKTMYTASDYQLKSYKQ